MAPLIFCLLFVISPCFVSVCSNNADAMFEDDDDRVTSATFVAIRLLSVAVPTSCCSLKRPKKAGNNLKRKSFLFRERLLDTSDPKEKSCVNPLPSAHKRQR